MYTAEHQRCPHYRLGSSHGDDIWEHSGYAVHFFSPALVGDLAVGWTIVDEAEIVEGDLPRRLVRVSQRIP